MGKEDLVLRGETLEEVIPGQLFIIQNDRFFKFGIDSVLLANLVEVRKGEEVLDLGTGSGIIPLLLAYKKEPSRVLGLEYQKEVAEMAQRSVLYNGLEGIIEIKNMDLRESPGVLKPGFDLIISNPPYLKKGDGKMSSNRHKAIARHELFCTLEDIFRTARSLIRYRGRLALVYRTERLMELMVLAGEYGIIPKELRFIHSRRDVDAKLVFFLGVRGGNPGLRVLPPLYIYNQQGEYTQEVRALYGFV